jgi:plasmid rolling circle replication initiator protein Rep
MANVTQKKRIVTDFPLDKLADVADDALGLGFRNGKNNTDNTDNNIEKLRKRARAKYVTNSVTLRLTKLDSTLRKSYLNTFFCASTLRQSGNKITGKYCNNRWCVVCNRIRTAKLIQGYSTVLESLPDKQFVTLTIPNVTASDLSVTIRKMISDLSVIVKRNKSNGLNIKLLRKLECTYNPLRNDYHPHFHLIVSGCNVSNVILEQWLKMYPEATKQAQDIRPADKGAIIELFKYFSKIISKGSIYPKPLDTIFRAMYQRRVFQPVGIKKITEDIEELQSEIYADLIEAERTWTWIENDWVDEQTGELLTGYEPSGVLINLLKNND